MAASREALSGVLSVDERARLAATDSEPDAVSRLRARQELANDIANERTTDVPTGEQRPELTAIYEERYREARNAIVESAPRASDWDEVAAARREGARSFRPSAGDRAADADARRLLAAEGAEVPR